jgi:ribosomal protein L37E
MLSSMVKEAVRRVAEQAMAAVKAALGQVPSLTTDPCDLWFTAEREPNDICAACGYEGWAHHRPCDFDEVGAEYERRWRVDGGQPPIPLHEEQCDACGETRAEHERRAVENGYRDLADAQAKLWPEA